MGVLPASQQSGLQGLVLSGTMGWRTTHLARRANLPWDAGEARGAEGAWHTSVPLLALGTAAALPREQHHPRVWDPALCLVGAGTQHTHHTPLFGEYSPLSQVVLYHLCLPNQERKQLEGCCPIHCPRMVLLVWAGWSHQACGDHKGTTQEPPVDHLLTFLPSSPGVPSSPWEQRLPVNSLNMGTKQRMAQSMGVPCHILPLPYAVLGSLSLSLLGEPQSQALFPLLTFLPFRPGLPSSPGLPWEEKKGSEGAPQALHQPEVPGPHWSLKVRGRGSWAQGEACQMDPAGIHRGHGTGCVPRVQLAGTYRHTRRSQGTHGARWSLLPTQPRQPL